MIDAEGRPLIVLATDSLAPSGMGEHMLALARAIARDHRVVLAFVPRGDAALYLRKAEDAGFEVGPIGDEAAFGRWLREIAVAVLHVHAGVGWEGHGLVRAGREAGLPVVRTEHLPYVLTDEAQKGEHRRTSELVDRLILVSEAAELTYRQAGIRGSRIGTVRNGIEEPRSSRSRADTRRALDIGEATPVVVTVARFTGQKNYGLLLAAMRLVVQRLPDIRFLLVGDGPERRMIEDEAVASGLSATAVFLGERQDVPDLLAAADLFVLPSRFEGLPLVILEAMASGLPIVATRIGGTCEALGSDYPWLVEPEDKDGLAARITEALADHEGRRRIAAANRGRFEQSFHAERMGRETAALYRSVLLEKVAMA